MKISNNKLEQQWESLIRLLVIGNDRKSEPAKLKSDESILIQLVELNQLRKAKGHLFLKSPPTLPTLDPSPPKSTLGPHSIHHLNLILDGTFPEALDEFIGLLLDYKIELPPESLPFLLNDCLQNPRLWLKIKPVIGKTGKWLQSINPAWQELEPESEVSDWALGGFSQRISFFKQFRVEDPLQALSLIERNWHLETPAMKTELIMQLQHQLSLSDESFLIDCLNDGDSKVNWLAARLLTQLPDSEFAKQVLEFINPLFDIKKEGGIAIDLPASIPWPISLLVSKEKKEKIKDLGIKSNAFYQILSTIPPKHWERKFDLGAYQIIKIYTESNWNKLLNFSMIKAAGQFSDEDWMAGFARYWFEHEELSNWNHPSGKDFIHQWPSVLFNKSLLRYFNFHPNIPQQYNLVTFLLENHPAHWEDKLSLRIIQGIKDWMGATHSLNWHGESYKQILAQAAYRINPDLMVSMQQGWPTYSKLWGIWQKEVETFLRTLLFRKEMTAGLKKSLNNKDRMMPNTGPKSLEINQESN